METRKVLNEMNRGKAREMLAWCAPELTSHIVQLTSEFMEVDRKDGNIKITTNQLVYDTLPEKLIRAGMPLDIKLDGTDLNGTVYKEHEQWKHWSKTNPPILPVAE